MDTTPTIDYALDRLAPVFDKLAEMGAAGWEIAVRQQVAIGVGYFVGAAAAALVLYVGYRLIHRSTTIENVSRFGHVEWSSERCVWFWLGMLSVLGGAPTMVGLVISGILHLLNPEWYAIQALMNLVS